MLRSMPPRKPCKSPSRPPSDLDVTIRWNPRTAWRAEPLLRRTARHVAAHEGFRTGQLSIVVLGRRAMSTLHERYMDQPTPTDVLSFDLGSDQSAGLLDAEIVVCADVAKQRAAARTETGAKRRNPLVSARAELALYVTHGLLHLAGYDDHTAADFKRMHAREDQLLAELGLGPVFSGHFRQGA